MRLKTLLVAAVGWCGLGCVAATSAASQDFNWTGAYVGATAGWAAATSSNRSTVDCPPGGYFCTPALYRENIPSIEGNGSGTLHDDNITLGLLAGYNWRSAGFVFGIEADMSALQLSAKRQSAHDTYPSNLAVTYSVGTAVETSGLFTARGRFGWASRNTLFYLTAGLALAELSVSNRMEDTFALSGGSSRSDARLGWVAGAGIEWGLTPNWTLRGEYLHVDLGAVTTTATVGGLGAFNSLATKADITAEILRAGIAYKF